MNEQLAFLRAIRTSSADDLPRLVYADWLEERGEGERAEFIRWGCANPDDDCECEGSTLEGLTCGYLSETPGSQFGQRVWCPMCQMALADGLPEKLVGLVEGYTYRRGFLHTVRCGLDFWAGGVCEGCNGSGRMMMLKRSGEEWQNVTCPDCSGDPAYFRVGRGPALVERLPLEEVVILYRSPWQEDDRDDQWRWWDVASEHATIDRDGNLHTGVFQVMWQEYPGARYEDSTGRG